MCKLLIWAFILLFHLGQTHNKMKEIKVDKMVIKWEANAEQVLFEVFAPTSGWVALGFNSTNNIVGTNLIMGASKSNQSIVEDHFVVSVGVHRQTELVGGKTAINNLNCIENSYGTTMKFSIPQVPLDRFHYNLSQGTKLWLICAYSQEDNFEHHSTIREHIEVSI